MRFPCWSFILVDGTARSLRQRWHDAIAADDGFFISDERKTSRLSTFIIISNEVIFVICFCGCCFVVVLISLVCSFDVHTWAQPELMWCAHSDIYEDLAWQSNAFHLRQTNTRTICTLHKHIWHLLRNATKPQTTTIKYESKIMRRISKRLSGHLECIRSVSISVAYYWIQKQKHLSMYARADRNDR